jgi:hypothetical protein
MCTAFLEQFLSPPPIVWLKGLTGSLSDAILCQAIASAIASRRGDAGLSTSGCRPLMKFGSHGRRRMLESDPEKYQGN